MLLPPSLRTDHWGGGGVEGIGLEQAHIRLGQRFLSLSFAFAVIFLFFPCRYLTCWLRTSKGHLRVEYEGLCRTKLLNNPNRFVPSRFEIKKTNLHPHPHTMVVFSSRTTGDCRQEIRGAAGECSNINAVSGCGPRAQINDALRNLTIQMLPPLPK
jgi:hypothetical protein